MDVVHLNQCISSLEGKNVLSLEICDSADSLLGILDHLPEQKRKCRQGYLPTPGLVQRAIVYIRADEIRSCHCRIDCIREDGGGGGSGVGSSG